MKTLLLIALLATSLLSQDAYDYESGTYIDIENYDKGEVEYYDYEDGQYKQGYMDVEKDGTGTIYTDDGNIKEVEMD